jgi:hypothetical protein
MELLASKDGSEIWFEELNRPYRVYGKRECSFKSDFTTGVGER